MVHECDVEGEIDDDTDTETDVKDDFFETDFEQSQAGASCVHGFFPLVFSFAFLIWK